MKLFKGTSKRRTRSSIKTKSRRVDDVSIGSELLAKDQFDIYVHKRVEGFEMFDHDTEVSSITTDDRRRYRYYSGSVSHGPSWCCCSGSTEPTETTDNTLLHSRSSRSPAAQELEEMRSLFDNLTEDEEEEQRVRISSRRRWRALFPRRNRGGKKRQQEQKGFVRSQVLDATKASVEHTAETSQPISLRPSNGTADRRMVCSAG